jgi:hypothetical protein
MEAPVFPKSFTAAGATAAYKDELNGRYTRAETYTDQVPVYVNAYAMYLRRRLGYWVVDDGSTGADAQLYACNTAKDDLPTTGEWKEKKNTNKRDLIQSGFGVQVANENERQTTRPATRARGAATAKSAVAKPAVAPGAATAKSAAAKPAVAPVAATAKPAVAPEAATVAPAAAPKKFNSERLHAAHELAHGDEVPAETSATSKQPIKRKAADPKDPTHGVELGRKKATSSAAAATTIYVDNTSLVCIRSW